MNSRMERYNDINQIDLNEFSRAKKNEKVYNDLDDNIYSRVKASENVKILASEPKEIDINKIKKYILSSNNTQPINRKILSIDDIKDINSLNVDTFNEKKDYDINLVLEKAKEKREYSYENEKYKKVVDIDRELLNKINISKQSEVFNNNDIVNSDLNTNEKTLVNLINTIKMNKEETSLLKELMEKTLNDEIALPIQEEVEKQKELDKKVDIKKIDTKENTLNDINEIDKSFYTSSLSFNKKDFEGLEELEKSVKKSSAISTFVIIIVVLTIVAAIGIACNYLFNLNLF